jgi:hypothetical protein
MKVLFNKWLEKTKQLQVDVYGADYTQLHSNSP